VFAGGKENGPGSNLTRGRRPVPQQDGVPRYQSRRGGVASKTDGDLVAEAGAIGNAAACRRDDESHGTMLSEKPLVKQ
jgi:hypothetical protein